MGTHLRDLAVATVVAVPALVLAALAMIGAVVGVAVMAVAGAAVAGGRTVVRLRPEFRSAGMAERLPDDTAAEAAG